MTIFPLWCSFTGVHLDSDCCNFMLTSEPKNSAASLRYALLNLKIDTTNPMSSLTPRWFPKLVLILHAHAGIKLIFTETHIDTHTHTWHDMTCKHHHPIPTPSSMSPRSKFSPGSDDARRSSKTIGPNLPRLRTPVITSRSVQNMEFFCGARLKWPNINM